MEENVHKGHRSRVRDDFLRNGFDNDTPKHKILEFILFYCIQRQDTNELAHQLLEKYKTLTGVLTAPNKELTEFSGITENGVALLKMILPVANICAAENKQDIKNFKSLDAIGEYVASKFFGLSKEKVAILLLDRIGRKLDFRFISEGDIESVGISVRDIISACLENNASAIVIAHNHPSGVALPSEKDLSLTEMLAKTLSNVGIKLLDHIIIASDDYISIAQSVKYREILN